MDFILDLQGFKGPKNQFICKELAVLSLNHHVLNYYLFKTPKKLQHHSETNKWITNNHHKLRFEDGDVEFDRLSSIFDKIGQLSMGGGRIFVKGKEKVQWVRKLCRHQDVNVIDLVYLPSLQSTVYTLHSSCLLCHPNCALQNVLKIGAYFAKQNNLLT